MIQYDTIDTSIIPFQQNVLHAINHEFDYNLGVHEVLLSGAIGSAKTTLMALLALDHCFKYPKARVLLGRLSMPELKETIYNEILEMIPDSMEEGRGKDYWTNETKASIHFCNGSRIISRSWSDKRYKKVRSLGITMAVIEELTENETLEFYNEIKLRVGRSTTIPEKLIIAATNPDSPSHEAHDYFIKAKSPTRHVYYSKTEDNPFLPDSYITQLKRDLDYKMAQRMLFGKWIDIVQEAIYYEYDSKLHDKAGDYKIDPRLPIIITFDFNIGLGKPLSVLAMQEVPSQKHLAEFHCFDEIVIEGFRTMDACEEMAQRPWFKGHITVCGDATGRHKDTRSKRSDWEIVEKFLADAPSVTYDMQVPRSNPPIRSRHNLVNAYLKNSLNEVRLFLYDKCVMARKGLMLTSFKKGSTTIEDDSKPFQHITTALGYAIHFRNKMLNRGRTKTTQL